VFRRGKKRPIPGGLVAVYHRLDDGPMRWGFVVPKSVGPAVVRNTVKRRLRSAAAELVAGGVGSDVVVRANQDAPEMSRDRWLSVLGEALAGRATR
jgi:ribonuclease P protein component